MAIFAKRNNGSAGRDSSGRYDVTHPGSSPAQKRDAQRASQAPATDPRNGRPMSEQRSSQAPRPPEPPIKIGFEANSRSGPELSRRATKRKDKAFKNIEPMTPHTGDWMIGKSDLGFNESDAAQSYRVAKRADETKGRDRNETWHAGMTADDAVDTYKATGSVWNDEAQAHREKRAKTRKAYG